MFSFSVTMQVPYDLRRFDSVDLVCAESTAGGRSGRRGGLPNPWSFGHQQQKQPAMTSTCENSWIGFCTHRALTRYYVHVQCMYRPLALRLVLSANLQDVLQPHVKRWAFIGDGWTMVDVHIKSVLEAAFHQTLFVTTYEYMLFIVFRIFVLIILCSFKARRRL